MLPTAVQFLSFFTLPYLDSINDPGAPLSAPSGRIFSQLIDKANQIRNTRIGEVHKINCSTST
jgi:hypothetical protein